MAYGDLSLRQFGDLDILIHKRDLLRAKELLISQGYQLKLTDAQEAAHIYSYYTLPFVRTNGKILVELHWALTGKHWPFPFDFDRLRSMLAGCSSIPMCSEPASEHHTVKRRSGSPERGAEGNRSTGRS